MRTIMIDCKTQKIIRDTFAVKEKISRVYFCLQNIGSVGKTIIYRYLLKAIKIYA